MVTGALAWAVMLAAFGLALAVFLRAPDITEGRGILIATLTAAGGWMFREISVESQRIRAAAHGYAAVIRQRIAEFDEVLADAELERFLALAPAIVAGTHQPPPRVTPHVPSFPDLKDALHCLHPTTIEKVVQWQLADRTLATVYENLGTPELSAVGQDRLAAYFAYTREKRDAHRREGELIVAALFREAERARLSLPSRMLARWLSG